MEVLHELTNFLSDRSFFEGLHNSLEMHRGQHPIYPYLYAYEGKFSFAKVLFGMTFALPVAADVVVSRSWKWFLSNILRVPEISYGVAHGGTCVVYSMITLLEFITLFNISCQH